MAQLIVTDFDGVVCDSVLECLLAAHNAWEQLQGGTGSQRILDVDTIPSQRQSRYRELRSYLRGAEDFIPLFLTVERELEVSSQSDFDLLRRRLRNQLPLYQQAFYTERDYLRREHRELWLELNPLFTPIDRALGSRATFEDVHILTTKRQADVEDILGFHGIAFPSGQIHSVQSDGKIERLRAIMESTGAAPARTLYVEDQIDYLISAAPLGVEVLLAEWGYVSEEQRSAAVEQKIPLLSREELAELLLD
ncbi:MAG: hypothetical protein U5P10_04935 [Spirochaetia bacterium]|nr:hypothetical protein [Spirochaetia bacterium]